jgi:MFS family permease
VKSDLNKKNENEILSNTTFITCLGDYLSFFAFLKIATISGIASIYAGAGVIIQSIATGVGGLVLNKLSNKYTTKTILIGTQLISILFSLMNLVFFLSGNKTIEYYLINLFGLTMMYVVFDSVKELHSRNIKDVKVKSAQIDLLSGLYKAQFIGPVLSYICLSVFPIWISLVLDLFSFFIASLYLKKISDFKIKEEISIQESISFLFQNKKIMFFLFLRAVTFWIAFGMFNSIIFKYIETLGHQTIDSAWMYVLIGLGSFSSTKLMKKIEHLEISEWNYAICGGACLGLSILSLNFISNYYVFLFICLIIGFFVGMETASTQTIRRDIMSDQVAPTYLGVEVTASKIIDIASGSIALALIASQSIDLKILFSITAVMSIITGLSYIILKRSINGK